MGPECVNGLRGSQPEGSEQSPVVRWPQAASESAAIKHLARSCAAPVPQQCSIHPLMEPLRKAPPDEALSQPTRRCHCSDRRCGAAPSMNLSAFARPAAILASGGALIALLLGGDLTGGAGIIQT